MSLLRRLFGSDTEEKGDGSDCCCDVQIEDVESDEG
jgi:hypothetical protein